MFLRRYPWSRKATRASERSCCTQGLKHQAAADGDTDEGLKGRVSNFWKPMLIFEITKTNMLLPLKGLAPILIDPPHIYLAYTTQATISSVKHKPLFHQNYLEKYVPGIFFPQTCCYVHRGLSTEKIRQIFWWCNVWSARVSQYQIRKFWTCILRSLDVMS